MTYFDLANLIFPDNQYTVDDCINMYPPRSIASNAIVTRYAPSPTGFIHLGALLASYTEMAFAKHTGGIFYLRIEDTDQKRTIPNGIKLLIDDLHDFKVVFDEGPIDQGNVIGEYGPYIQTQRGDIYRAFVKHLLQQGKAYPCFCSEKTLAEDKEVQGINKEDIGYRGQWAHCRHLTIDESCERIQRGDPYIIRLRAETTGDGKLVHNDLIKGTVVFPQNTLDIVILKRDGFPTYHLAHVIDDTLMGTTHVIRADEWLSSIPIHLQLSSMLDFPPLKYAHIAPLLKRDGASLRKLSKRKDPECAVSYYSKEGLPPEAVMLYLAGISNSNFEDWIGEQPNRQIFEFPISFDKISKTGAIFDLDKLMHISRNYIARLDASKLYELSLPYMKTYDPDFYKVFTRNPDYSMRVLNIDRDKPNPRKDIAKYSQIKPYIYYMYDELFCTPSQDTALVNTILIEEYLRTVFKAYTDPTSWYSDLREYAHKNHYATSIATYKKTPNDYAGHIGHICDMLRYIATGQRQSPDLFSILTLLGRDRLQNRFESYRASLYQCTQSGLG